MSGFAYDPAGLQSLIGLFACMALAWLLSEDKKRFPWKLAVGALAVQLGLVLLLFGLAPARAALQGVDDAVDALASATQEGSAFVFGFLAGDPKAQPYAVTEAKGLFLFAFRVLPVILVVCALSALLWHWRILKWVTRGFGFVFQKTLGLRGPPALAAAATIFMGQVEGPIFIRAYLDRLSRSELFTLMAVGLACVSGSTMVAYVGFLKDYLPNAAGHILTASIMSAPAGVLLARIMIPAGPAEELGEVEISDERRYHGSVDAVIRGAGDGLNVVLNVAATLIVFVAFVALANKLLAFAPDVLGAPLTVQRVLGWLFMPLAWAIGAPWHEAEAAGGLLGDKLVLTEFTAFRILGQTPPSALSEHTRMIMTYALCGFANIASVGITVAGFGALVPDRRAEVIAMAWRALIAGFLATCMTASIIGALPPALFHSN